MDFRWKPTAAQRELFEEWRGYVISYLVSCKEGVNIRAISAWLVENMGEDLPYQKMGFTSINMFLYAMNEYIEVRRLDFKLFIFIRDNAVPENLLHVRQLVNGQAKDKSCKSKNGVIRRPTKAQSMYCRAEELLTASQFRPPSSSTSTATFGGNYRPVVVPQSSYSGRRPPTRGSYAGSRPSSFNAPQQPRSTSTQRSSQLPPRLQNRNNLTTSRPSSSFSAPVRSVQRTSSSTSSAAASYVYQAPKPSFSAKENVPKPAVVESSWDSWSTAGTSSRTTTTGGPPGASTVASAQLPIRYRHIEGLVDDKDEDFGYSGDSEDDGFDYCGGPIKKSSKGSDKFETFEVKLTTTPSVTASQPATASSTSSTSAVAARSVTSVLKPLTASSNVPSAPKQVTGSSNVLSAPKPVTGSSNVLSAPKPVTGSSNVLSAPKPVTGSSNVLSAPKPVTVSSNVSSAPNSVVVTPKVPSTPKPVNLPATEVANPPAKRQSYVRKPMRTLCLDSENTIYPQDVLKNGTVRIMLNLPKITFPAYFRGGSVKANMSLKAYLAGYGNVK